MYANTGYDLLYMVIEAATGASYADVLRTRIFEPLGMHATTIRSHAQPEVEGMAVGYGKRRKRFTPARPVLRHGGGAVVTTMADLVTWEHYLTPGALPGVSSLEPVWTPAILNNGDEGLMGRDPQGRLYKAGFGWFLGDEAGRGLVHHSGGVDGFSSNIDRYRDAGLTVIVLTNLESALPMELCSELAEHYFAQVQP